MSSSRSVAAARARRAGEQNQMNPQSRPVTSINSQAAFAQQQQPQGRNVRVTPGQQYMQQQQQQVPQNIQQNIQQASNNNNQPAIGKLSISDAVGLITLRLGRVEQYLMTQQDSGAASSESMPTFDKSILSNIMLRLDTLEKKDNASSSNETVMRLEKEIKDIKELLNQLTSSFDAHLNNYNNFVKETDDRFGDYELAISDLEKNMYPVANEDLNNGEQQDLPIEDISELPSDNINEQAILSSDLKKTIKLELGNIN